MLCCGYTLTDFPISIRLTSLALWQSNDFPNASKATLMNMDKYFMWIHYERLHNHNKAKHNKTVSIFLGIYCTSLRERRRLASNPPVFYSILLITHHITVHSRYIEGELWGVVRECKVWPYHCNCGSLWIIVLSWWPRYIESLQYCDIWLQFRIMPRIHMAYP